MRTATWVCLFSIFLFSSHAWAAAETIAYDPGGRRDPFIPLVGKGTFKKAAAPTQSEWRIEGIIHDPFASSLVIIDGELYKEGDQVNNANIISIFEDRIIIAPLSGVEEDEEDETNKELILWIHEELLPGD